MRNEKEKYLLSYLTSFVILLKSVLKPVNDFNLHCNGSNVIIISKRMLWGILVIKCPVNRGRFSKTFTKPPEV